MQKTTTSLVTLNIVVAMFFFAAVASIEFETEPPKSITPEISEVVAQKSTFSVAGEVSKEVPCNPAEKGCENRSMMWPVIITFLAGGMFNIPSVSSLPCI